MKLTVKKNEYKHAVLAYLNQWYELDRVHQVALRAQTDRAEAGSAFRALAIAYSVIRGFGGGDGSKTERERRAAVKFRDVARLVDAVPPLSDGSLAREAWTLAISIGKLFPRQSRKGPRAGTEIETTQLSAATKFLWFAGHHNVRIFDTQAYAALYGMQRFGILTESVYCEFLAEWKRQYELARDGLDEAIGAFDLHATLEWTVIPYETRDDVRDVLAKPWFRERVFDKYLWIKGARILNEIENARRERASARSRSKT
ncbi:hypothetical protein [Burkholderia vietnamiensis]|uniref:hypothetical protein n=1 Tax=Burkholderia vietnamiensis TaxID=60552 RepID=UPI00159411B3|nr:hypothetical protein [Burkholderia vietnamiensis]